MPETDFRTPETQGWFNRTVAGGRYHQCAGRGQRAARFISSTTVGMVWTAFSPKFAFTLAVGFMLTGTLMILRVPD